MAKWPAYNHIIRERATVCHAKHEWARDDDGDGVREVHTNIAVWTESYGWIVIGQDDDFQSFLRALDMGGMVWEGKPKYKTVDAALDDVDAALDDVEAALEKIIEEIG